MPAQLAGAVGAARRVANKRGGGISQQLQLPLLKEQPADCRHVWTHR